MWKTNRTTGRLVEAYEDEDDEYSYEDFLDKYEDLLADYEDLYDDDYEQAAIDRMILILDKLNKVIKDYGYELKGYESGDSLGNLLELQSPEDSDVAYYKWYSNSIVFLDAKRKELVEMAVSVHDTLDYDKAINKNVKAIALKILSL